jgi:hypothetical protein
MSLIFQKTSFGSKSKNIYHQFLVITILILM